MKSIKLVAMAFDGGTCGIFSIYKSKGRICKRLIGKHLYGSRVSSAEIKYTGHYLVVDSENGFKINTYYCVRINGRELEKSVVSYEEVQLGTTEECVESEGELAYSL